MECWFMSAGMDIYKEAKMPVSHERDPEWSEVTCFFRGEGKDNKKVTCGT